MTDGHYGFQRVIDIHTHFVPESYLRALPDGPVTARIGSNGDLLLTVTGKAAPPMTRSVYDPSARLPEMDAAGIRMHVLSVPPPLLLCEAEADAAAQACRLMNDGLAAVVGEHPDRFAALGAVPLQDPDRALAELQRCRRQLGMPGIILPTHIGPRYLDHADFADLLAAAEQLGALVLVHPRNPPGAEVMGEHYLANTVGNPLDTTICIARLIHSGTLDRFPGLRLCFAHGGGFAVFNAGRLEHAWRGRPALQSAAVHPPSAYLRRLYFDSCTHSPQTLGFLVGAVGPGRVLLGSDAPQDMADPTPLATLAAAPGIPAGEAAAIAGVTAAALLGIEA